MNILPRNLWYWATYDKKISYWFMQVWC